MKETIREINHALGEIVSGLDEKLTDRLIAQYIQYYLQAGSGHSLRTARARGYFKLIFDRFIEGKQVSFSRIAEKILEGLDLNPEGLTNLRSVKNGILIANHPSDGPLRGLWPVFGVNLAVAREKKFCRTYETLWIQTARPENQIYTVAPLAILRTKVAKLIERGGCTITFRSGDNQRAFEVAKEHLKSGGFLGFFPEGRAAKQLTRAHWKAARLLQNLTDWQAPLIPVALWYSFGGLNIRFGERLDNQELLQDGDFQKIADRMIISVARLLPEEKRGVYKKVAFGK